MIGSQYHLNRHSANQSGCTIRKTPRQTGGADTDIEFGVNLPDKCSKGPDELVYATLAKVPFEKSFHSSASEQAKIHIKNNAEK